MIRAGFPSPADDYLDDNINLHEYLVEDPPATFIVRVRGDSMIGAGIADGDLLVVDKGLTPVNGDIVVAVIDGPAGNTSSSQASPELEELRLGGPRNEYRVGLYTLSHAPGLLRIGRQPARPDALEEVSKLRYQPGSDQVRGLYQEIPHEFRLLHIRIIRCREQHWKSPE